MDRNREIEHDGGTRHRGHCQRGAGSDTFRGQRASTLRCLAGDQDMRMADLDAAAGGGSLFIRCPDGYEGQVESAIVFHR